MVGPDPTGVSSLSPWTSFLWAAGGSFALELVSLLNGIKSQNAGGLPAYYKSWVFWFLRVAVAGIAGALAVAEGASSPLVAVNIGASAPAILELLSKKAPHGG